MSANWPSVTHVASRAADIPHTQRRGSRFPEMPLCAHVTDVRSDGRSGPRNEKRMKHFLSGAMAAGWFCLAMAVFAQSMSVSPEPATPGDGIRQGECLQPAVDQRIVGSPREEFVESCLMAN